MPDHPGKVYPIGVVSDFPLYEGVRVEVEDEPIAVFHLGDAFYAIGDTCTHQEESLAGGEVIGTTVECPWHGATFDLKTGKALTLPAHGSAGSYTVVIDGDQVSIIL